MLMELHCVLPAADIKRARTFYQEMLDLEPDEVHEATLVYHSPGGTFEIYETPNAGSAKNTQMGWVTNDLEAEMARLRERGVVFEQYDNLPGMDMKDGIAYSEEGRAAWFRDTEGNFLVIEERA
ncbi:VOC family protein [Mycetocola sp. 2940]|uniref:VOC family protein n=1 Tax=Mycetocola sp. 2940 TaxID=3156452 RepID=UPI0033943753